MGLGACRLPSSGRMRLARALPSSTPHWSKLLMPQMAVSSPQALCFVGGLTRGQGLGRPRGSRILHHRSGRRAGRFGKVRWGARVPMAASSRPLAASSARTSASLRPIIRASAWASRLARQLRMGARRAFVVPRRGQDELLDRHHVGPLVQHLEEGVLGIGARLAEHHRRGERAQLPAGRRASPACRWTPSPAAAGTRAGGAGAGCRGSPRGRRGPCRCG